MPPIRLKSPWDFEVAKSFRTKCRSSKISRLALMIKDLGVFRTLFPSLLQQGRRIAPTI
jgi:hypothetical protein